MATKAVYNRPVRYYHYRGLIEGKGYKMVGGFSGYGSKGGELQPYMTFRECQAEARKDGHRAVFLRPGDSRWGQP